MKKQVYNPYLPLWEYIPDGEPRVFNNRLYIYGSHDRFAGKWYCENDYVTWSAPLDDLSDWRYEGVIFRKSQDAKRSGNLYAPDVIQGLDGKYYLYYSKDDSSVIGVAVSNSPAGPFEYMGEVSYADGRVVGDDENEFFMFDPSVLIDDGKIWLYSGSAKRKITSGIKRNMVGCTVMELQPDMKTVKSAPRVILPNTNGLLTEGYFEGPSARKIGNLYYVIYPVKNASGLHYATSIYPDRDFVHRGAIHSTSDIGINGHSITNPAYPTGNSHGGLVEINGKWFIFDHRNTNGTGYSRQGVAEPVEISKDGTIIQVESTSCGLNGGSLRDEGIYPASIACNLWGSKTFGMRVPMNCPMVTQSGVDDDKDAEFYITRISNKSVVGYKYFYFRGGSYRLKLTIRGGAGSIQILTDKDGKKYLGEARIMASECWCEVPIEVGIPEGVHEIYISYLGKKSVDLKEFKILKLN